MGMRLMQTSWVAGFLEGLWRLKRPDVQMGSVAARGEMTGFLAARYAAALEVPRRPVRKVVRRMPIVRRGMRCGRATEREFEMYERALSLGMR